MSLDAALRARVAELARPVAALLEVLCIAERPLTQEVASLACKLEGAAFVDACAVLRVARLCRTDGSRPTDSIGPYHDRVTEALTATLPEARQVEIHDALTAAFERTGGDARAIVRHAQAANQPERAARNALLAAEKARETMAFDRAAEFYRTAIALGQYDGQAHRELHYKLACSLASAGRGPEAAETFELLCRGADPAMRRDCQRQAAEQWLITGRIDRGLGTINLALEEIGEPRLLTPIRALSALLWRRTFLGLRGLRWDASSQGLRRHRTGHASRCSLRRLLA